MTADARGQSRARPAVATSPARWLVPGAVAIITFVAFLPALSAGFVAWDDDKNFVTNFAYRGLGPEQLAWMWTTFHLGTWIPLSWMTLGFDYVLWGMNPAGYHLTNLVLHAANAVVVYAIATRLFRASGMTRPDATPLAAAVPAAFAALVFAVHPLRVESVAWITERRDVLSGLFYFSSVLWYLRSTDPGARRRRYWVSVAFAACALLAKGTAVTLPIAIALLNVYPLRRIGSGAGWWSVSARRVYRDIAPFVVLSAVFTVVVFAALQPVPQLSVPGKVAVSAYSLWFYLSRTLVPLHLSPLYSLPETVDPARLIFAASYVAVIGAAAAAWAARRRWPGAAVALAAFAAILFPLLGVHQGGPQIVADRNTYNAAAALALIAGGAFAIAARKRAVATGGTGALVVIVLAVLTWKQTGVWRDSRTLWTRVLQVEPDSPLGHNNFGNLLFREDRIAEAVAHYRAAIAAKPAFPDAHLNLGVALARSGQMYEAITAYRRAVELRPDFADAESNWGAALAQTGDLTGAIEHYARAITIEPGHADAHVNWGNALVRMAKFDEAIAHYDDALRHRPDYADAHLNWGVALALAGRPTDAAAQFERVLALQPNHQTARDYLATVRQPGATPPR